METICNFTGKELSKYNRFYNPDGSHTDVNVYQFLEGIQDLPEESLQKLLNLVMCHTKIKFQVPISSKSWWQFWKKDKGFTSEQVKEIHLIINKAFNNE